MPAIFAAIIPFLASVGGGSALAGAATLGSLASAGVGLGVSLDNLSNANKTPNPTTTTGTSTPTPTTNTTTPAQVSSIAGQFPSLQQNLGGSVSPDYYVQMLKLLSGQANQPGANNAALEALNQLQPGGSSSGLTTSPVIGTGGG